MPYPPKYINDDEVVALDVKPHWWFFSHHILTGIPLIILGVLVYGINGTIGTGLHYFFWALFLAWVVWLACKFLSWQFTYFMVSDQRVAYRTGVISRHGTEIPLASIASINFHQGIWTRIIGAGTLHIESAGRDGDTRFTDVRHPDEVQREIYRQRNGLTERHAQPITRPVQSSGSDKSVAEQLAILVSLRDAGNITDEEYAQQKASLMGPSA